MKITRHSIFITTVYNILIYKTNVAYIKVIENDYHWKISKLKNET